MGGSRVPAADSAENRLDQEVVGNKEDAAVATVGTTKSLVAMTKGILNAVTGASAAGAVGAVADTAVQVKGTAATDTGVAMLKGILDALNGAAGLTTWPASAAPGNAVSIAEALRQVYDDVVLAKDALFGTAGIATFPASAAPANAVSMAEVLRQVYDQTGIGSEFWLKKTLVCSAILQAGVDLTGVSAGGELAIEDVVVKTDATGLAAMTNFELETNNAKGLPDFFVTAASGLGASKTIDLANASVTKIRTVLESGAKVVARASAADGTGAGTIDVYVKFRRLAAAATIAAA